MYKNLCEIAAHKKTLQNNAIFSKKISLNDTAFSRRKKFFSGYSVSLFHKSSSKSWLSLPEVKFSGISSFLRPK